jgi:DNA repair exonuclease SbcCD ATPase subunit
MIARLTVSRDDGWQTVRDLKHGGSLIIGSSSACGLRLESPSLCSIHCSLRLEDGQLWLRSWSSESTTLVDNQPIDDETQITSANKVQVADYTIRVTFEGAGQEVRLAPAGAQPTTAPHVASVQPAATAGQVPAALENPIVDKLARALYAARAEADQLREQLACANHALETSTTNQAALDFERETNELLRDEVEQLQVELAQRDAQLAELAAQGDHQRDPLDDAPADTTDTAALVDRLDQLLDELERSDERTQTLEDLLRTSEEANRAEQEERQQLEAWVADVENRIGQREAEWQAETEALQLRLEEAMAERAHAEQQLRKVPATGKVDLNQDGELQRLREQNAELHQKLIAAEQQRSGLAAELEKQASAAAQPASIDIEEALREQRLELAQEKAAVARQRMELNALRGDLERLLAKRQEATPESDNRMNVYRQNLKEIQEREERKRSDRSLKARIGRLWQRMDSRT